MTDTAPPQIASPGSLTNDASILTHSRMATYKTCQRKHWLAYEQALKPDDEARPLRFGRASHLGLDLIAQGLEFQLPIRTAYADTIRQAQTSDVELDLQYELETVITLLRGYVWRWSASHISVAATEFPYKLPIVNPETGYPTNIFTMGGKIDKIIRLEDGRLAVMEHKTAADDLSPESDYWRRLRIDSQISGYIVGARGSGYDVQTVLYDVIRKPTIRPTQVPFLDDMGLKVVVVDATGERALTKDGKPRQSSGEGMHLLSRPMLPEEWAAKLEADIMERPDYYYARMEIARTEAEIDEYRAELWQIQQQMRESQRTGRWFRNTSACIGFGKCKFFSICAGGGLPSDGTTPNGFRRGDIHEELE